MVSLTPSKIIFLIWIRTQGETTGNGCLGYSVTDTSLGLSNSFCDKDGKGEFVINQYEASICYVADDDDTRHCLALDEADDNAQTKRVMMKDHPIAMLTDSDKQYPWLGTKGEFDLTDLY